MAHLKIKFYNLFLDIKEKRLKTAKEFGADFTLSVDNDEKPEQQAKTIRDMLGAYPDKTIDCSGFESSVQLAVEVSTIYFMAREC